MDRRLARRARTAREAEAHRRVHRDQVQPIGHWRLPRRRYRRAAARLRPLVRSGQARTLLQGQHREDAVRVHRFVPATLADARCACVRRRHLRAKRAAAADTSRGHPARRPARLRRLRAAGALGEAAAGGRSHQALGAFQRERFRHHHVLHDRRPAGGTAPRLVPKRLLAAEQDIRVGHVGGGAPLWGGRAAVRSPCRRGAHGQVLRRIQVAQGGKRRPPAQPVPHARPARLPASIRHAHLNGCRRGVHEACREIRDFANGNGACLGEATRVQCGRLDHHRIDHRAPNRRMYQRLQARAARGADARSGCALRAAPLALHVLH
mmetsp:Transcript_26868/g.62745  ORF Transcript_26868/g.62745 Transcript_26868/m.62745 type:complete len:322 (-) Transcript_26868:272-1237(-)